MKDEIIKHIKNDNIIAVKKLLSDKNVNLSEMFKYSILYKKQNIANMLINYGVDVNAQLVFNYTEDYAESYNLSFPIIIATKYGLNDTVKKLIENKAHLNVYDLNFQSPLYFAIINNNYTLTKLLLENGADVNARITVSNIDDTIDVSEYDFLRYIMESKNSKKFEKILNLLVKYNFDFDFITNNKQEEYDIKDDLDNTYLYRCIWPPSKDIDEFFINFLLSNVKTKKISNYFRYAIERDRKKAIKAFLKNINYSRLFS